MSLWEKTEALADTLQKALPDTYQVVAGSPSVLVRCPGTGITMELTPKLAEVVVEVELFVVLAVRDLRRVTDQQSLNAACRNEVQRLFDRSWLGQGYDLDATVNWQPASSTRDGPADLQCYTQAVRQSVHRARDIVKLAEHASTAQQFTRMSLTDSSAARV